MNLEPMYSGKVNSPATFLAKNITAQDVKLEVLDPSVLPEAPNLLCLGTGKKTETVLYNKIEGNFITECVRGFQGEAKDWDKLTVVARIITEYDFGSLQRNLKNHAENNNIHIGNGNIRTEAVADKSITSPKIADGAITSDKIAAGAITTVNLSEEVKNNISSGGGVDASKIPDNSIVTGKIKDGSITEIKLADNSVTTNKIKDSSITTAKLSEEVKNSIASGGSVDVSKIPDNSIVTGKIKDGSVTEIKLADNAVATNKIKDGSITEAKLASSAVTTNKIKDGSITTAKLSQEVKNSISSGGSGGASAIPNNSITADKIKDVQELSNHVVIGNGAKYTVYKDSDGKEKNYPTVVIGNGAEASTYYSTAISSNAQATGSGTTALGYLAQATGSGTTALGYWAKAKSDFASTSLGALAEATGSYSTTIGYWAQAKDSASTALGYLAKTTTSNQIMLGRSSDTPYAYHSLVVTSDKRDKSKIKDISFNSLDFINKLKPKQYKMDCRSNYTRDEEISKEEYEKLDAYTKKSHTTKYTVCEIENGIKYINYCNRDYIYKHENKNITKDSDRYKPIFKTKDLFLSKELAETELRKKLSKEGIENPENTEHFEEKEVGEIILKEVFLESDGSRAGERYHNGFLAQEVEEVAKSMNFDFAGVKYLAHNGDGEDMYGLAYEEFIAPIISAIQILSKENNDLKNKLNELETKLN